MPKGPIFIPDKTPDLRSCVRNRWGTGVDVAASMSRSVVRAVCSDGGDGCFVASSDTVGTGANVRLHRVVGTGQLSATTVVQTPLVAAFFNARLVPSLSGSVIVVWAQPAWNTPLLAQRFDAQCAPMWPQPVELLPRAGGLVGFDAVTDGNGGAVVSVSSADRSNSNIKQVLAQRLSAAGTLPWGVGGTPVSGPPALAGHALTQVVSHSTGFGVVWQRMNPSGPGDIQAAWLDGAGGLMSSVFTLGNGFNSGRDDSRRFVAADPAGGLYVAVRPAPLSAPLQVLRLDVGATTPTWVHTSLPLAHVVSYALAPDGQSGLLLATADASGTVGVTRLDDRGFSHWAFKSAKALATVPVAVLSMNALFDWGRLLTVAARSGGGAMVTFEDHQAATPRLMSWCCDDKGTAVSSGATVAVGGGMGQQGQALTIESTQDTSIVVWAESSGAAVTALVAQKLGCCGPDVPEGRLLPPPPSLPCAIPFDLPVLQFGGMRLLLGCGGRNWRGGLLPLPFLHGLPGFGLPGVLGARGVPSPDWVRIHLSGVPVAVQVELRTHKNEVVAAAKAVAKGDGPLNDLILDFAPSAKRSYVLVFQSVGKGVAEVDLPVGLSASFGQGKPPPLTQPRPRAQRKKAAT